MVSGFVTSPNDQDRIFSGLASEIFMALKSRGPGVRNGASGDGMAAVPNVSMLGPLPPSDLQELDVEAERLQLADEHVERLGQARLVRDLALDDRLVDLRPALDVVGLDREELLERVGRAVRLQGPHLHLAEPLAAELRLA